MEARMSNPWSKVGRFMMKFAGRKTGPPEKTKKA